MPDAHPSFLTILSATRAALDGAGEFIGSSESEAPRFELFNAPNSICSQKVRAVLAFHEIPYVSQSMNIFAGETYLPAYVRLRLAACDDLDLPLVAAHSGSTSVATGGCDPAVVPTLVDLAAEKLIVDSKRICLYIDATIAGRARLRPAHLAERIDAELDIVDNLPNYQMLSGRPPGEDHRPASRRGGNGVDFAMSKVGRCDRYLAEFADDKALVRGYAAKRCKELQAAQQLFSAQAMRAAYDKAEEACEGLEGRLAARGNRWLLADEMTMADLYWAIELLRMKNLGADALWSHGARPAVADFVERAERVAAIRSAVIDWPGAQY
ncbi:glutathione S-transferase family protein [Methylibium sp.]|uniref:glutathione S-transferase family protein n=1 Tax=Methylibium sp. TaxID=2067992 RepID=UPI003D0BF8BB